MRGNTVSLKGNVTRDAEVRRTQSGNTAVSFGIAWNQSRKNQQGGYEDVPHYFDVQMWVTDAQLRYVQPLLVKGARCAIVDGHLEFQSWQENQGNKRSKVVVRVDDPINGLMLQMPSNAQPQGQPTNYPPQQQNAGYTAPQQQQGMSMPPTYTDPASLPSMYDSDIPF